MKRFIPIPLFIFILWMTSLLQNPLVAQESGTIYKVGDPIKFPDNSWGMVCYVDPNMPTRGWAMALEDISGSYTLTQDNANLPGTLKKRGLEYVKRYDLSNYSDISYADSTRKEGKTNTQILRDWGNSPAVNAIYSKYGTHTSWYIPNQMQLWTAFLISHQKKGEIPNSGRKTMKEFNSGKVFYLSSIISNENNQVWALHGYDGEMSSKPASTSFYIRPVRDFGYDDAVAYWKDSLTNIIHVSPDSTMVYYAMVIYGKDTLIYPDTVFVHPSYNMDTIYELACNPDNPFTSLKNSNFTDVPLKTGVYDNYTVKQIVKFINENKYYEYHISKFLKTKYGCDSILNLNLTVLSDNLCKFRIDTSICENDLPLDIGKIPFGDEPDKPAISNEDRLIYHDGTTIIETKSISGTPGVTVTVSITTYPNTHEVDTMEICLNDTITWKGKLIVPADSVNIPLVNDTTIYITKIHPNKYIENDKAYSCPGIDSLVLTIHPIPTINFVTGQHSEVCANSESTLEVNIGIPTLADYTFFWSGDLVVANTNSIAYINVPSGGCGDIEDTVYVHVMDGRGCKSTMDTFFIRRSTITGSPSVSPLSITFPAVESWADTLHMDTLLSHLSNYFQYSGYCTNPHLESFTRTTYAYTGCKDDPDTLKITLNLTDACGNNQKSVTIIQQIKDTTAPKLVMNQTSITRPSISCVDDTVICHNLESLKKLGFTFVNEETDPVYFVDNPSSTTTFDNNSSSCMKGYVTTTYTVEDACHNETNLTVIQPFEDLIRPLVTLKEILTVPAGECKFKLPNDFESSVIASSKDNCGSVHYIGNVPTDAWNQQETEQYIPIDITVADGCNNQTEAVVTAIVPAKTFQLDVSPDMNICSGRSITLHAHASADFSDNITYQWRDNCGNNSCIDEVTDESITTTNLTDTSIFYVTAFVNGCSQEDSVKVNVVESISHTIEPATLNYCMGANTATLSLQNKINGGSGNYHYQWYINSNAYYDEGNQLGISSQTAGVYDYSVVVSDETGCQPDSFHVALVTVNPSYKKTITRKICEGESYEFTDKYPDLTETGIYTDTLQAKNGCDSIVTLTLIVNRSFYSESTETICDQSELDWEWEGHKKKISIKDPGTYILWDSCKTAAGCDSVYKMTLNFGTIVIDSTKTICREQLPYTWHGIEFRKEDCFKSQEEECVKQVSYGRTPYGCDSVLNLHLRIYEVLTQVTVSWPADITGQNACKPNAIDNDFSTLLATDEYIQSLYVNANCGEVIVTHTDAFTPESDDCAWTIVRTFTITACNKSITQTQSVSGGNLTTPIEVGEPVPTNSTVQCIANATPPTTLPLVKDACDNTLNPTTESPTIGGSYDENSCSGTRTYTYTYRGCANTSNIFVWTYTYNILPPVLTFNNDGTFVDIENVNACYSTNLASQLRTDDQVKAMYSSNCDRSITVTHNDVQTLTNDCNWKITRTFTITDGCNSDTKVQFI
ncbi:MAG: hypothetical protein J6X01_06975, partial [Bacteroidales bacterium]|nr:hypothetical protein [Bacteroidales bacterium]